jgi:hypothetical protein
MYTTIYPFGRCWAPKSSRYIYNLGPKVGHINCSGRPESANKQRTPISLPSPPTPRPNHWALAKFKLPNANASGVEEGGWVGHSANVGPRILNLNGHARAKTSTHIQARLGCSERKGRKGKEMKAIPSTTKHSLSCHGFSIGWNQHDPRHGWPRATHVSSGDQQTLEATIVHGPCCCCFLRSLLLVFYNPFMM